MVTDKNPVILIARQRMVSVQEGEMRLRKNPQMTALKKKVQEDRSSYSFPLLLHNLNL